MKRFAFVAPLAGLGILFGCSSGAAPTTPAMPTMPTVPAAVSHQLSAALAHRLRLAVPGDHGKSWMLPTKKKSILIYAAATSNVGVFEYPSGKQVGTLTGFDEPESGCVDAKGDIFMTNFGDNEVFEFAHGGTKVLKTYIVPGDPIGCSVDKKGDLAVTSFSPGEVAVFPGGDTKTSTTYSDSDCEYMWPMGYDDKGNLVGVGESSAIDVCALLAGSKTEVTLSAAGITIDFPGGTVWDGKYIALGDQEAYDQYNTGIHETSLSGRALKEHHETVLTDTGCGGIDAPSPFILGKKNTPVNEQQGSVVVAPDGFCANGISYWHYPNGGDPYDAFITNYSGSVIAVSIGS